MRSLSLLICRVFPTLLVMSFLISCQPAKQQNDRQHEICLAIDPAHLPQFAKLSELVESVRIIPLETGKSNLIGITNKVFVGRKDLLITTADSKMDLFRFTSDGKFLNKIGNQGRIFQLWMTFKII